MPCNEDRIDVRSNSPPSSSIPSEDKTGISKEVKEDEDEDVDLPTRAEIIETSRRLFPKAAYNATRNTATTSSLPVQQNEEEGVEEEGGEFDLTSILSSLQGMKEEIAGITDMEERRKAAARVALGLVWALEGDS